SIKAKHGNLEKSRFLKVTRSFLFKVRTKPNENNPDELAIISERKEYVQHSADSLRTCDSIRRVHGMT
ncbi:unnamed protein product, partial [Hymenolepis diminuta]